MPTEPTSNPDAMFRFAPFAGFAAIARRHFEQMQTLATSLPPEPNSICDEQGSAGTDDHLIWDYETRETRELLDEHAAIVVVFSCAAAELYINDAAARLLGDTYFETHIDRLDLISKWVLVPRLVNGYELDRGAAAYNFLRLTVALRNQLMHPKSGTTTQQYWKSAPGRLQEAAGNALKMLSELLRETHKFDRHELGEAHL